MTGFRVNSKIQVFGVKSFMQSRGPLSNLDAWASEVDGHLLTASPPSLEVRKWTGDVFAMLWTTRHLGRRLSSLLCTLAL